MISDRRAVASRGVIFAIALAIAGIGAVGYAWLNRSEEADPDASVPLKCAKCGAEFRMALTEYLDKTGGLGTDIAGAITCSKCGAARAVSKVMLRPAERQVSQEDLDRWARDAVSLDEFRKQRQDSRESESDVEAAKKRPPRRIID